MDSRGGSVINLKHIKLEVCECGGTPVEESIDHWHKEERKFSCGRRIVLRGGNETNYSVEDFTLCPNTAEARLKKLAIADLQKALLIVVDMHKTVDEGVRADVRAHISNSLAWRLR
jgi:hypothetical protein